MLRNVLRSLVGRASATAEDRTGAPRRLHLGCGGDIRAGWINLDSRQATGVDVVADLDRCRHEKLPFADGSIDEFMGNHVLEHLADPLALMEELYRIARPGAQLVFRVPYGSSDDADLDPTHVKRFFMRSFYYFSQLGYTHFDYGYRGDWDTESIVLTVDRALFGEHTFEALETAVRRERNVVLEMIATLRAVKPARPPGSAKPAPMRLEFQKIDLPAGQSGG